MDTKATLAAVSPKLAAVTKARSAAAAVLADGKADADRLNAARMRLVDAQGVLNAEESALAAIERQLVIAADDNAIAEREARLGEIATNRTRVGVMIEEIDVRTAQAQRDADRARLKAMAVAKRRELGELATQIAGVTEVAAKFEALLDAGDRVDGLYSHLERMAEQYPDIPEFRVAVPAGAGLARQELQRLSLKFRA
jgi:hypothetical protein